MQHQSALLPAVLKARELTYGIPEGRVLQERLCFDVLSGEMLLITGSNGCGKSTLLKTLLGEVPVLSGKLIKSDVFQRLEYIPQLENTEIHLPLTLMDVLAISQEITPSVESIESFGLLRREQLSGAWNTASGGERKRTLLTRALLKRPSLLIFDEPMNHLDHQSRKAMIRVMANFLKAEHEVRAIVMVCHQGLHPEERELFQVVRLDLDRKVGDA